MHVLYLVTNSIKTTGRAKTFGGVDPMQPIDKNTLNQNINQTLHKNATMFAFTSFEQAAAYAELNKVSAFNPGKRGRDGMRFGRNCIIVKAEVSEETFEGLSFETKNVSQYRDAKDEFYQVLNTMPSRELTFAEIKYNKTTPLEYEVKVLDNTITHSFSNKKLNTALQGLAIENYNRIFHNALSSISSGGVEGIIALCDDYLQSGLLSNKHWKNEVTELRASLTNFKFSPKLILGKINEKIEESMKNGNRIDGHYHQLLLFAKAMLTYRYSILEEPALKVENKAAPQPSAVISLPADVAKVASSLPAAAKPASKGNAMSQLMAAINDDPANNNAALKIAAVNKGL